MWVDRSLLLPIRFMWSKMRVHWTPFSAQLVKRQVELELKSQRGEDQSKEVPRPEIFEKCDASDALCPWTGNNLLPFEHKTTYTNATTTHGSFRDDCRVDTWIGPSTDKSSHQVTCKFLWCRDITRHLLDRINALEEREMHKRRWVYTVVDSQLKLWEDLCLSQYQDYMIERSLTALMPLVRY